MEEAFIKRLISERRSKTYYSNELFIRVIGKKYRGAPITMHSVQNWFYNKNQNPVLEEEYVKLLQEKEPELFLQTETV